MLFNAVLRFKRGAGAYVALALTTVLLGAFGAPAANVTLAWDTNPDPTVAGYRLYYGSLPGIYTNMLDAGNTTSATVSNLLPQLTYYFAATSYTISGLESVYSAEVVYTVPGTSSNPGNVPPTLNNIADVTLPENAGTQTIPLTGITSGSSNEVQTLTVTAFSSNPALIPNPSVNYTSPATTGSLTFQPVSNSFGVVVVTVMVDDGGAISNTLIRTFAVTINPSPTGPPPLTNAVISPYTYFGFQLVPPFTNRDRITYSLGPGAPAGAMILTSKKGGNWLGWTPTLDQASSTNLIAIVLTDKTNPLLSTNFTVQVIVLDYLGLGPGSTSVQSGQAAALPLYLTCSDGVTNATLSIGWSAAKFLNPALSLTNAAVGTSSLINQGSNLVVSLATAAGQVLQGSNLLGTITFQTISNQPSAFVSLPVSAVSATKPTGAAYTDCVGQAGQVVVVNDVPLLQAAAGGQVFTVTAFGTVGNRYQLQSASTVASPVTWSTVTTYTQTNIQQTLSAPAKLPAMSYRLKQQ